MSLACKKELWSSFGYHDVTKRAPVWHTGPRVYGPVGGARPTLGIVEGGMMSKNMSTKAARPRFRMEVRKTRDGLSILLSLTVDEADRFTVAHRKHRRVTSQVFQRAVREVLGATGDGRDRSGVLQPQIPDDLRRNIDEFAKRTGHNVAGLLRDELSLWIDFKSGKRRTISKARLGRSNRTFKTPEKARYFRDAGRKLIVEASKLVRYSFDAGLSKAAIEDLSKALRMTKSALFACVMERVIAKHAPCRDAPPEP